MDYIMQHHDAYLYYLNQHWREQGKLNQSLKLIKLTIKNDFPDCQEKFIQNYLISRYPLLYYRNQRITDRLFTLTEPLYMKFRLYLIARCKQLPDELTKEIESYLGIPSYLLF